MGHQTEARLIRGHRFVGCFPGLLKHPADYCLQLMLEHRAALLRVKVGPASFHLVTRPEHLEHILSHNTWNYWKGPLFGRMRFVLGDSLLLSEGEEWKQQRRQLQPAFTKQRIRAFIPLFCDLIRKRQSVWASLALTGETLDLEREMRLLTLQLNAGAMFSKDMTATLSASITETFEIFVRRFPWRLFTFFLPEWVKVPGQRETERAVRRLDRLVYDMVTERRRALASPSDLLSMILAAGEEHARTASPAQAQQLVRDHVITTLFGSYEATATTLSWLWCLLAKHPAVAERVRTEVDAVLGIREPTYEDLSKLVYTEMVIEESLRLYPPFWESFRTAYREDEIDGVHIPAGASFLLCPYATHRNPELWPNPNVFDPERFAPNAPRRHRFAYFPFLEGQRACIGKTLALTEIKLIVALSIREYQFDLPPDYVLASQAHGTLRPSVAPRARVSLRAQSRSRI